MGGTSSPRFGTAGAIIAWIVILALAGFTALGQSRRHQSTGPTDFDPVGVRILELQSKYAVAAARQTGSNPLLISQLEPLDSGTVGQRLRFAIVVGEILGPREALERLDTLRSRVKNAGIVLPERLAEVDELLHGLYARRAADGPEATLPEPESRQIIEALGWFGELALAPADGVNPELRARVLASAGRLFWTFIGLFAGLIALGFAGVILVALIVTLVAIGRMSWGLRPSATAPGIYVETFAVWMIGFMAAAASLSAVLEGVHGLAGAAVAFPLSLCALAWPVIRGVPWRQVRHDIGWHGGRNPLREIGAGFVSYAMCIPLLAIGVGLMLLLVMLTSDGAAGSAVFGGSQEDFSGGGGASHPIVAMAGGSTVDTLILLLVAAVWAPIVEETMFRGVLYRHLRGVSWRFGAVASAALSAVLVAIVFAIIHPQGLVAVPALGALAIGFAMTREWRDSIIAPVIAHGLNNGLIMITLTLAFGT